MIEREAEAVSPTGKVFTTDRSARAAATRSLMEHLRSFGEITSGPKPFSPKDKSGFLSALDVRQFVAPARSAWLDQARLAALSDTHHVEGAQWAVVRLWQFIEANAGEAVTLDDVAHASDIALISPHLCRRGWPTGCRLSAQPA